MIDVIEYFISLLFVLTQSFITKCVVKKCIYWIKLLKTASITFFSHEIILCNDGHSPRVNTKIKGVSQKKSNVYKYYEVTEVFKWLK